MVDPRSTIPLISYRNRSNWLDSAKILDSISDISDIRSVFLRSCNSTLRTCWYLIFKILDTSPLVKPLYLRYLIHCDLLVNNFVTSSLVRSLILVRISDILHILWLCGGGFSLTTIYNIPHLPRKIHRGKPLYWFSPGWLCTGYEPRKTPT